MSTYLANILHVIGTHEAVAEVAMFLCQDTHVRTAAAPVSGIKQTVLVGEVGFAGDLTSQAFHNDPLLAVTMKRPGMAGFDAHAFGIQPLPAQDAGPALVRLSIAFDSTSDAGILSVTLSERFPDVTVGLREFNAEESVCRFDGHAAGEEIISLDASTITLGADWDQRVEDADDEETLAALQRELQDERDAYGLDQLTDLAHERSRMVTPPAAPAGETVTYGWPRWSLLAHAAFSDEVAGLHDALAAFETHNQKLELLKEECRNASARGIASWMDTALFGDPVKHQESADSDATLQRSYTDLTLDHYAPRQLRLLSFLATAGDVAAESSDQRALADALLSSLADPDARLSSGMHPAVFLTAACAHAQAQALAEAPTAVEGLEKLLVELASRVPRAEGAGKLVHAGSETAPDNGLDLMLCSVVAIAMQPHVVKSQLKPAIGAGVPPAMLVRSIVRADQLAPNGPDGIDAAGILRLLTDSYGTATGIPNQVTEEFELIAPQLARSYEALRTAELMQAQITAAPSRPAAPGRRAPGV